MKRDIKRKKKTDERRTNGEEEEDEEGEEKTGKEKPITRVNQVALRSLKSYSEAEESKPFLCTCQIHLHSTFAFDLIMLLVWLE